MNDCLKSVALTLAVVAAILASLVVYNLRHNSPVKLYEVEGCTVWRFRDRGEYHYFTLPADVEPLPFMVPDSAKPCPKPSA